MIDIKIKSINKDDFENFKTTQIELKDGTRVRLNEICDFKIQKSLEKLIKDNGEINFYVFANVNPDILTSNEALRKLEPLLEETKNNNIKIILKGEAQKNKELKHDMMLASALGIVKK